MKNNTPWDIAFSLDDIKRSAFCIIFAEMEGRRFNWTRMEFDEPDA